MDDWFQEPKDDWFKPEAPRGLQESAVDLADKIWTGQFKTRGGESMSPFGTPLERQTEAISRQHGRKVPIRPPDPNPIDIDRFINSHVAIGDIEKSVNASGQKYSDPDFRRLVRQRMEMLAQQKANATQPDTATKVLDYIGDRLPFAGHPDLTTTDQRAMAAAKALRDGKATQQDFNILAQAKEREEQAKYAGIPERVVDFASRAPGMIGENLATGGTVGPVTGAIGQTVLGGVSRYAGNVMAGAEPAEAGKGLAQEAITNAAFAAAGGMPGLNQSRNIAVAVPKMTVASNIGQEASFALGLTDKNSAIVRAGRGESDGLRDLIAEIAGFATVEAAPRIANHILDMTRSMKSKGYSTPKIQQAVDEYVLAVRQMDAESLERLRTSEGLAGQRPRLPDTVQPPPPNLNIGPQGTDLLVPTQATPSALDRPGRLWDDVLARTLETQPAQPERPGIAPESTSAGQVANDSLPGADASGVHFQGNWGQARRVLTPFEAAQQNAATSGERIVVTPQSPEGHAAWEKSVRGGSPREMVQAGAGRDAAGAKLSGSSTPTVTLGQIWDRKPANRAEHKQKIIDFITTAPEGATVDDGLGGVHSVGATKTYKSGTIETQVYHSVDGKDNPSAMIFVQKKKDGTVILGGMYDALFSRGSTFSIPGEKTEAKLSVLDRIRAKQSGLDAQAKAPPTLREEQPTVTPNVTASSPLPLDVNASKWDILDAAKGKLTKLQEERLLAILDGDSFAEAGKGKVSKQAVAYMEGVIRKKLGMDVSLFEWHKHNHPDRVASAVEEGKLTFEEAHHEKVTSYLTAQDRALLRIDAQMEALSQKLVQEKLRGKLTAKREAEITAEFTRLDQERQSRYSRPKEADRRVPDASRPVEEPPTASQPEVTVNQAKALTKRQIAARKAADNRKIGKDFEKEMEQEALDAGMPLEDYRAALKQVKEMHAAEADPHNELVAEVRDRLGSVAKVAHRAEDAGALEGFKQRGGRQGQSIDEAGNDIVAGGRHVLDANNPSEAAFQKVQKGLIKDLSPDEAHKRVMQMWQEALDAGYDPSKPRSNDPFLSGETPFAGIPIPAFLRNWLARRQASPAPPVAISKDRNPPLQNWDEYKLIASEPRGAALFPGLGKAVDPRARADTPAKQATIAWAAAKGRADNIAHLVQAQMRGEFKKDPFKGHPAMSDAIREEMANPGSQNFNAEQKAFVRQWSELLRQAERNALSVNRKWTDKDGNALDPNYFPATSIESPSGKGGKGQSWMGKFFASEAAGKAAGVEYMDSAIDRAAEFLKQQGRLDAKHLLANDPALGGRTPQQWHADEMKKFAQQLSLMSPAEQQKFSDSLVEKAHQLANSKDQPGSHSKVFEGKIYPDEVAKDLIKQIGEKPYGWLATAEQGIDASKTLMMGTADFATPMIQLVMMPFRHPLAWSKSVAAGVKRLAFNKDAFAEMMNDPANREAASSLVQSGGSIGERLDYLEGTEKGSLVSKIPIAGKVLGPIAERNGQAVTTLMDVAKLELWKSYLAKGRPKSEWPAFVEQMENSLGLGRSRTIGISPGARVAEKFAMVAPSYYRSALNMVGDLMYGSKPMSREALKTLGSFAAGSMAVSVAGMIAAGLSWDEITRRLNPGNSKFLMFPVSLPWGSKQELGIGGLYRSIISTGVKTLDWVASGGKVDEGQRNPLVQFARSKEGFALRYLTELSTQEDYQGNPQSATRATIKMFTPITLDQLVNRNDGTAEQQIFGGMMEFVGARNFPGSPRDAYRQKLDAEAKRVGKSSYDRLTLREQIAAVAKAGPIEKPQATAQSMSKAIAYDMARRKDLNDSLSKDSQTRLAQLGKLVPGYDSALRINSRDIPLTQPQLDRFKALVVEEYNRTLAVFPMERLMDVPKEQRDKWVSQRLTEAKERATNRLKAQFADAPSR